MPIRVQLGCQSQFYNGTRVTGVAIATGAYSVSGCGAFDAGHAADAATEHQSECDFD